LKNLRERGQNYFFFFLYQVSTKLQYEARQLSYNGLGLCVVALNINLKLTTTLDRAITQNPCYVPLNLE
jgi:hypothetical protein